MTYGLKGKAAIVVFDLLRKGNWVDYDEAKEIGKVLPWVPELYRGPWDKELLFKLAEGKSKVSLVDQIREGIVVKPIKERNNLEIGRTQLKIVSNAYLERAYLQLYLSVPLQKGCSCTFVGRRITYSWRIQQCI